MRRLIFALLIFALPLEARAPQASSTFTVTMTFTKPTQMEANQFKRQTLRSFALQHGLAIYTDGAVDNSKIEPAVEKYLRNLIRRDAKAYNRRTTSQAAEEAQRLADDAELQEEP